MSTTTVGDLLSRAQRHAWALQDDPGQVTHASWAAFDATVQRVLHLALGPPRTATESDRRRHARLAALVDAYPTQTRMCRNKRCAEWTPHHPPLPEATSKAPLDRLTVTLATLGDLLHGTRQRDAASGARRTSLDDLLAVDQVPPVLGQVLAIAQVTAAVAEQNFPRGHIATAGEVARYAEQALDLLGDTPTDSRLHQLASRSARSDATGVTRQLEECLHRWARTAREELNATIPSTEVLRNIASQSLHLYALTDAIAKELAGDQIPDADVGALHDQLRQTAGDLQRLAELWRGVTTASRPSAEYVQATIDLHHTLEQAIPRAAAGEHPRPAAELHLLHVLGQLRHATADIADLLNKAAPLPELLARSHVLYAPVKSLPTNVRRLHARLPGNLAPMSVQEARPLIEQATVAAAAAGKTHTALRERATPQRSATGAAQPQGARPDVLPEYDLSHATFPSLL